MSGTSIVVDIVVAVLLVVTIAFVWRLERRIAVLKREEAKFAELLGDFAQAAARADQSVKALKLTADSVGRDLESVIARAQGLREDVQYLLDRAGPVTDRLSDAVMRSRIRPSQSTAGSEPGAARAREQSRGEGVRSDAGRGEAGRSDVGRGEAGRRAPAPATATGIPAGADPADLASLLQSLR
jgi:hypothetical protein